MTIKPQTMEQYVSVAQQLLASVKAYDGAIDGYIGDKTRNAVTSRYPKLVKSFSAPRLYIAVTQALLTEMGFEPGRIDGYWGHNTQEAYGAWRYKMINGKDLVLDATPTDRPKVKSHFPKQKDCVTFYGQPGPAIEKQLVSFAPPYRMRLDWDLAAVVNTIRLHEKCAESAKVALQEIAEVYGQDELNRLGLNRFAGGYMHRKMRGGSAWSMHAYGCALDFFAAPNGLTVRCPDALFCGKEYVKFFDIWESYGWVSLGRAIGRDWMHVQAARL